LDGQPNNSLNRSAIELGFDRQLGCIGGSSRPVNSGVMPLLENAKKFDETTT
jgi:hypothetical protein